MARSFCTLPTYIHSQLNSRDDERGEIRRSENVEDGKESITVRWWSAEREELKISFLGNEEKKITAEISKVELESSLSIEMFHKEHSQRQENVSIFFLLPPLHPTARGVHFITNILWRLWRGESIRIWDANSKTLTSGVFRSEEKYGRNECSFLLIVGADYGTIVSL